MCTVSCVTRQLSPVTSHLTTTLFSFSCYDSPRMFGEAVEGGLVIDREAKRIFFLFAKNTN